VRSCTSDRSCGGRRRGPPSSRRTGSRSSTGSNGSPGSSSTSAPAPVARRARSSQRKFRPARRSLLWRVRSICGSSEARGARIGLRPAHAPTTTDLRSELAHRRARPGARAHTVGPWALRRSGASRSSTPTSSVRSAAGRGSPCSGSDGHGRPSSSGGAWRGPSSSGAGAASAASGKSKSSWTSAIGSCAPRPSRRRAQPARYRSSAA
jgi:hypothetical protein